MGCDFTRSKRHMEETPVTLGNVFHTEEGEERVVQSEPIATLTTNELVSTADLSISLKAIRLETDNPYRLCHEQHGDLVKAIHRDTRKHCWLHIHALESDVIYTEMKKSLMALRELDHPNVLKVLDVVHCGKKVIVAYEDWSGGDARKLQKCGSQANGMSEKWAVAIMRQLLNALHHCHTHKLVLKSFSLRNILFLFPPTEDSTWVKLLVPLAPNLSSPYTAPEISRSSSISPMNDVYSAGMILQSLLLGNCWNAEDKAPLSVNLQKIMRSRWEKVNESLRELTLSMLCKNPLQRISLPECLSHPGLPLTTCKPTLTPSLRTCLRNISVCKPAAALKKVLLQLMLNMVVPCERLWETQQAFREVDLDGNGGVSEEELRILIYRLFPESQAKSAFASITSSVAFSDKRELSYSEFTLFALSRQVLLASPHVSLTFQMLDREQDQQIISRELQNFLYLGHFDNSNTHAWQALIASISKGSDTSFNYNQLIQFLE